MCLMQNFDGGRMPGRQNGGQPDVFLSVQATSSGAQMTVRAPSLTSNDRRGAGSAAGPGAL